MPKNNGDDNYLRFYFSLYKIMNNFNVISKKTLKQSNIFVVKASEQS